MEPKPIMELHALSYFTDEWFRQLDICSNTL